MPPRSLM
jgi:putative SOS response-associated peptidase YedK